MFQRFRRPSSQASVSTTPESLDSPREEARRDTSVMPVGPQIPDPVAPEGDVSAVEPEARGLDRTEDAEYMPHVALDAATDAFGL